MKVKNLAKDAIVTLKALKLEFEKFWTNVTVLKKLCVGKHKLKRQAQPKLKFQNENFIVALSKYCKRLLHTKKNTKMHLTALFNVWKKDLIRIQLERKKFLSEKRIFFHGNVFRKDSFHDFANFSISENIPKFTLFRNVLFPLNEKYSGLHFPPFFQNWSE